MPTNPTIATDHLVVDLGAGAPSQFHFLWLRDNCPEQQHPLTGHRVEETSTLTDTAPTSAELADGQLIVRWADAHECRFDLDWLRRHDYSRPRADGQSCTLWTAADLPALPRASYPTLLADPAVRVAFIDGFLRYGVGLLHDVPTAPGTVAEVGAQLGQVRTTSWGTIFDVQSMTDSNSLAFTGLALVPHTDEAYRDPSPTIQLQHFLTVDTEGGDATLVDGFAVAEQLRADDPAAFDLLAGTLLQFRFSDGVTTLEAEAPTITLDPVGRVTKVRYSNHSVQPFRLPFHQMAAFYRAYQAFGRLRRGPRFLVQIAMPAGSMYLVDNERVMHGRTALLSGGARHLQSCYIEKDELRSGLEATRRLLDQCQSGEIAPV